MTQCKLRPLTFPLLKCNGILNDCSEDLYCVSEQQSVFFLNYRHAFVLCGHCPLGLYKSLSPSLWTLPRQS